MTEVNEGWLWSLIGVINRGWSFVGVAMMDESVVVAVLKSLGEGRRASFVDLNCEGVRSLGEPIYKDQEITWKSP